MLLLSSFVCGCFGAYAASQKGRSPWEGLIFGTVLGPFGVVAVASLPRMVVSEQWSVVSEEKAEEEPVDVDAWDVSQVLAGPRDARMPKVKT